MAKPKKPVQKSENLEETEDVSPSKLKKEIVSDLDGADSFGSEKIDDSETLAGDPDETSELSEDGELDTEELNPFGDKWEE